jgi:hypothetical protein
MKNPYSYTENEMGKVPKETKCYCGHTTYCDCGTEEHIELINSNIEEFDKAIELSKQTKVMKNIHIIPTDKPSKLYLDSKNNICITDIAMKSGNKQNIYITDNSKIREGDWFLNTLNNQVNKCDDLIYEKNVNLSSWCKKIILTTDQDLIKNGVQAIDDDFLEWFVKNPSCEEVEVDEKTFDEIEIELNIHRHDIGLTNTEFDEWLKNGGQLYKIIFPPKKELKTEKHLYTKEEYNMVDKLKEYLNNTPKEQVQKDWDESCKQVKGVVSPTIEEFIEAQTRFNKQETLEEALINDLNDKRVCKLTDMPEDMFYLYRKETARYLLEKYNISNK